MNLKSNEHVPIVHAAQEASTTGPSTMRIRDVLSIEGGKLAVTRYGTSVHHE